MKANSPFTEQLALLKFLVKWGIFGTWVGGLSGVASAGFLLSLDWAGRTRGTFPWLLFLLPLAGFAIVFAYGRYGNDVAAGNNLLLERIHDPEKSVPFRMAPMILISTVVTHLFGGSAGREGTAVQMGGTLAGLAAAPLRLSKADHSILLMTGVSAGFGSVFGTPLAGAIFGMEVLSVGRMRYNALVPCLMASFVGDLVCRSLGVVHHQYQVVPNPMPMSFAFFGLILVAGACFAAASATFTELTHWIQSAGKPFLRSQYVRVGVGSAIVIGLTFAVGTQKYNGLSLPLLERALTLDEIPSYAFLLKILFTAVTLGVGFKGGEVTPLFVIGATLGHSFGVLTGQPPVVFAALGFAAVFAGAANTPLACTIMGIELFGASLAVPLAMVCVLAYILSGHRGIYVSQRIPESKGTATEFSDGATLSSVRSGKSQPI